MKEVDDAKHPDKRVGEPIAQLMRLNVFLIFGHVAGQQSLLRSTQPACLLDTVIEIQEHRNAHDQRGQRFNDEQPLPTRPAPCAPKRLHDPTRKRSADNTGDGDAVMNSAMILPRRAAGYQ